MRKLVYSMSVSLDGFIAGPDGDIAWSAPDQELHSIANTLPRERGHGSAAAMKSEEA